MKSLLTVAALLAGLATPALAEEAATPTPPAQQAAVSPSQDGVLPVIVPQSKAVEAPMSVPLESNAAPAARGGGCNHANKTVYLTN